MDWEKSEIESLTFELRQRDVDVLVERKALEAAERRVVLLQQQNTIATI